MGASSDDLLLARLLVRPDLPPAFERWLTVLEPGAERATNPGEWAGALVLIERGAVEAVCAAGGHETFTGGDLVALGWLPITTLRNPAGEAAHILAIRRRGDSPRQGYLRILPFRARRVG